MSATLDTVAIRAVRSLGRGLLFEGLPSDDVAFTLICEDYGCSGFIADRILADLKRDGNRKVTISGAIRWRFLARDMAEIGVTVTQIPPKE